MVKRGESCSLSVTHHLIIRWDIYGIFLMENDRCRFLLNLVFNRMHILIQEVLVLHKAGLKTGYKGYLEAGKVMEHTRD